MQANSPNTLERLQFGKLQNSQKQAFFTYAQVFKGAAFSKAALNIEPLARTVAAMANAIGGEVFLGFKLEKSKIKDWEAAPSEWPSDDLLLELIQEQIQPAIKGLKIERIESPRDSNTSIAQIIVPESRNKAHMSSNYKFYKRVLAKNQLLEEFEIRQLYQTAARSDLKIFALSNLQGIPLLSSGLFETLKFYPRIHIQNEGEKIEKDYKLELQIPSALIDESFTVLHQYLKGYEKDKNVYSIPGTEALFQSEAKIMIELVLKINADNYQAFLDSELILKLYSTEQLHEKHYRLSDWFHYKGKLPLKENFVKRLEV